MAIRCVFYTPGAEHTCQVLRLAGASPQIKQTQVALEARCCKSGRFIACPMFLRVERGLLEAHRFRKINERRATKRYGLQVAS